ncbi:hypothetical protein KM043_005812 [Ampulex compressa]|nr:hypothetical protein KM043_005812 [Ampulex compressa]
MCDFTFLEFLSCVEEIAHLAAARFFLPTLRYAFEILRENLSGEKWPQWLLLYVLAIGTAILIYESHFGPSRPVARKGREILLRHHYQVHLPLEARDVASRIRGGRIGCPYRTFLAHCPREYVLHFIVNTSAKGNKAEAGQRL